MILYFKRFIFISKSQYLTLQSLSPGLVKTEMVSDWFLGKLPYLNPEDIADAVLYVLGTPPHVQVRRRSARQP
jgi:NADP+-dependent farnesol dehydrogenase